MQKSPSLRSADDHTVVPINRGLQNGSSVVILDDDPPFSHGFFDKDPESSKGRSLYFKAVMGVIVLVCTYVIWGVLPIYWASVYDLYNHVHNLHGWVVVSMLLPLPPHFHYENNGCFRISMEGLSARQCHKLSLVPPVQPHR